MLGGGAAAFAPETGPLLSGQDVNSSPTPSQYFELYA